MAQSGNAKTSEHAGEIAGQTTYRQGAKPPADRKVASNHSKKVGVSYGQTKFTSATSQKGRRALTPGHTKGQASAQTQSKYRNSMKGY